MKNPIKTATDYAIHYIRRLSGSERRAEAARIKRLTSRLDRLHGYLAGASPGVWASNHMEQTKNHYTGNNYCAIRAICRMGSRAIITAHRGEQAEARLQLRSCRKRSAAEIAKSLAAFRDGGLDAVACQSRVNKARQRVRDARKDVAQAMARSQSDPKRTPLANNHPLMRILRKPNPWQSGSSMLYASIQQICITGSALIWQVPNAAGVPVHRYVIPTALSTPMAPSQEYPHGAYRVAPTSAFAPTGNSDAQGLEDSSDAQWTKGTAAGFFLTGGVVDARQIKVYRWPHPLYLTDGLSPLDAGALWCDTAKQIDMSRWAAMYNITRPGVIIKEDPSQNADPEDLKRLKEELRQAGQGTHNVGRNLWLPPGTDAEPWATTPAEMDFTNAFEQLQYAIFGLHGVAPIAAGLMQAGNYAAFFAALLQTRELTVQPTLSLFADEDSQDLSAHWGEGIDIGYEAYAINDPEVKLRELQTGISGEVLTYNEVRQAIGYEPTRELWGDMRIGTAPNPNAAAAAQQKPDSSNNPDSAGNGAIDFGADDDSASDAPSENATGIKDPVRTGAPRFDSSNGHASNGKSRRR